jgi:hypothetical protein
MSQANRTANHLEPLFHPVSHYNSPDDVLNDARLSSDEKRVILSSWASDMYVVESRPGLRQVPGIPHRLRVDDILAALKQLDDETDPPPRGGLAMRLPRLSRLDCDAACAEPRRLLGDRAATKRRWSTQAPHMPPRPRWTREENVRRYRKLLNTRLTDIERNYIERRLSEELHG